MSKTSKRARGKAKRSIPYPLIALGIIFTLSMLLRVVLPYGTVFVGGDTVIFAGNDAWYHIRLAENMAYNFPWPMFHDHYTWFPHGSPIIIPPLMSWLIAGAGYIVGSGYRCVSCLEVAGAWLPPILGSLTLVPVYFIGKEMHSKWTGVLAAAIIALMPTIFLSRSTLGFADHHVLEVLLIVTTMMFLMMGYRSEKPLYYVLAGIALGFFHLAWQGAIFMLFVIWLWFVVQFLVDYWRSRNTRGLWQGLAATFGTTCVIYLPWSMQSALPRIYSLAPILATATPLVFALLACYLRTRRSLAIAVAGVGGIITLGTWLVSPSSFIEGIGLFEYAFSIARVRTISETLPLHPKAAFDAYGVNLVLFFGGLFMAARTRRKPLLVVVWSIVVFIAVSTQCRWDYYFAIAVGLMSAYFFTTIGTYFIKEVRKGLSLVLCVAFLFITIPDSLVVAKSQSLMTEDWYVALSLLRENSPEPFDDPGAYYRLELNEEPQYGILSWWDYGHWITKIGHRVPVANPFQQGAVEAADFFVNGKEIAGVKYVMVDEAMLTNNYYAMVAFLGEDPRGITKAPEDSAIVRLVNGQLEGYRLIHRQNTVLIFEKEEK